MLPNHTIKNFYFKVRYSFLPGLSPQRPTNTAPSAALAQCLDVLAWRRKPTLDARCSSR